MTLLRRCLQELWGLIVDDAAGALLTVAWIAAACLLLPSLGLGAWAGPLLFAGLAAIFAIRTRSQS